MKKLILGLALTAAFTAPAFAALKVGDTAPDFSAKASLGGKEFTFSLKDALKKGPTVVYFYPSAYTGGCDLEAHTFAENADKFAAAGAHFEIGLVRSSLPCSTSCMAAVPVIALVMEAMLKTVSAVMAAAPPSARTPNAPS